ncbi:hypothetical protein [Methylobacterium iners]|uniref:Uncharacterized protein n=1 Tax=Methylobacterium iners TaxID=418707 RepID=A0ABQ4S4B5_9HYPH|nr:hypothetical protein [Methylobacterium iners]GJD97324.1 hypothetical protein OCOJLMKI_4553 [Methylobacterium iners]
MTLDVPPTHDAADALLDEAIRALRISGCIVQKLADPDDTYSIYGWPPVIFGGVVALAWDTGLMGRAEGVH